MERFVAGQRRFSVVLSESALLSNKKSYNHDACKECSTKDMRHSNCLAHRDLDLEQWRLVNCRRLLLLLPLIAGGESDKS